MRENASQLGSLVNDFDFAQTPRPPLVLPTHPAPGPASNPPGSGSAGNATQGGTGATAGPGNQPQPGPPPGASAAAGTSAGAGLALTASAPRLERLHLHHQRISLVLGCTQTCALDVTGQLSLERHGHHVKLRETQLTLAAGHSQDVSLSLSRRSLLGGEQRSRASWRFSWRSISPGSLSAFHGAPTPTTGRP